MPRKAQRGVGVEVVLYENDLLGLGEMDITQFFDNLSIVNGRAPLGDFDVSPAFERGK
jgi:hypothetical protein